MLQRIKKALATLLDLNPPEYQILTGSRRVIKDSKPEESGYYDDDSFRFEASAQLAPFLRRGESVFYEIVGYAGNDTPIMPSVSNHKVGKDFVKKFGDTTHWTYGCIPGQFKILIYNWMISGEDGHHYSYPWDYIEKRCRDYGLQPVPLLHKVVLSNEDEYDKSGQLVKCTRETLAKIAEEYTEDQFCTLGNHLREGVCLRVEKDGELFEIYKNKSRSFYILEDVFKSEETYVDTEEVESYQ